MTMKVLRGDRFRRVDDQAEVEIMAVADGYAMVRRLGFGMPFVLSVETLHTSYDRKGAKKCEAI